MLSIYKYINDVSVAHLWSICGYLFSFVEELTVFSAIVSDFRFVSYYLNLDNPVCGGLD